MIFVAKLDFTVPLTSVSARGVCLPILSVTHKFSLCPGEAPLPPAEQRLEGRMPLVFPAESCCVLSPPPQLGLCYNKVRLLYPCLPFLLVVWNHRPA